MPNIMDFIMAGMQQGQQGYLANKDLQARREMFDRELMQKQGQFTDSLAQQRLESDLLNTREMQKIDLARKGQETDKANMQAGILGKYFSVGAPADSTNGVPLYPNAGPKIDPSAMKRIQSNRKYGEYTSGSMMSGADLNAMFGELGGRFNPNQMYAMKDIAQLDDSYNEAQGNIAARNYATSVEQRRVNDLIEQRKEARDSNMFSWGLVGQPGNMRLERVDIRTMDPTTTVFGNYYDERGMTTNIPYANRTWAFRDSSGNVKFEKGRPDLLVNSNPGYSFIGPGEADKAYMDHMSNAKPKVFRGNSWTASDKLGSDFTLKDVYGGELPSKTDRDSAPTYFHIADIIAKNGVSLTGDFMFGDPGTGKNFMTSKLGNTYDWAVNFVTGANKEGKTFKEFINSDSETAGDYKAMRMKLVENLYKTAYNLNDTQTIRRLEAIKQGDDIDLTNLGISLENQMLNQQRNQMQTFGQQLYDGTGTQPGTRYGNGGF